MKWVLSLQRLSNRILFLFALFRWLERECVKVGIVDRTSINDEALETNTHVADKNL